MLAVPRSSRFRRRVVLQQPARLCHVPALETIRRRGTRRQRSRPVAARQEPHGGIRRKAPLPIRRGAGVGRRNWWAAGGKAAHPLRDLIPAKLAAAEALRAGRPRRGRVAQSTQARRVRSPAAPRIANFAAGPLCLHGGHLGNDCSRIFCQRCSGYAPGNF